MPYGLEDRFKYIINIKCWTCPEFCDRCEAYEQEEDNEKWTEKSSKSSKKEIKKKINRAQIGRAHV